MDFNIFFIFYLDYKLTMLLLYEDEQVEIKHTGKFKNPSVSVGSTCSTIRRGGGSHLQS